MMRFGHVTKKTLTKNVHFHHIRFLFIYKKQKQMSNSEPQLNLQQTGAW